MQRTRSLSTQCAQATTKVNAQFGFTAEIVRSWHSAMRLRNEWQLWRARTYAEKLRFPPIPEGLPFAGPSHVHRTQPQGEGIQLSEVNKYPRNVVKISQNSTLYLYK